MHVDRVYGCDHWPSADPAAAQCGVVIFTAVAVLDGVHYEETLQALSPKWIFHPSASSWNTVLDAGKKNEDLAIRALACLSLLFVGLCFSNVRFPVT